MMKNIIILITLIISGKPSFSQEPLYPVLNNEHKWGFKNESNELVIDYLFEYAEPFVESRSVVRRLIGEELKYGFIDISGNIVCDFKFDSLLSYSDGMAAFMENGKWGFLNLGGSQVIKPSFSWVSFFYNGFDAVLKKPSSSHYSYIDHSGKIILKNSFSDNLIGEASPPKFSSDSCLSFYSKNQNCQFCLDKKSRWKIKKKKLLCSSINLKPSSYAYEKFYDDSLSLLSWLKLDTLGVFSNKNKDIYLLHYTNHKCDSSLSLSEYGVPYFGAIYQNPNFREQPKMLYPVIIDKRFVYVNDKLQILVQ